MKPLIYLFILCFSLSASAQDRLTEAYYKSYVLSQIARLEPSYTDSAILGVNKAWLNFIYDSTYRWSNESILKEINNQSFKRFMDNIKTIKKDTLSSDEIQAYLVQIEKKDESLNEQIKDIGVQMDSKLKLKNEIEKRMKGAAVNNNDSQQLIRYKTDSALVADYTLELDTLTNKLDSMGKEKSDLAIQAGDLNEERLKLIKKNKDIKELIIEDKSVFIFKSANKKDILISIEDNQHKDGAGLENQSFKMPSQSDIIDGLAIYMANRFKEELSLTFFENLKEQMLKKNPELVEYFPLTAQSLFSTKNYETPTIGDNIIYSFAQDLLELPGRIGDRAGNDSKISLELREVSRFVKQLQASGTFLDAVSLYTLLDDPKNNKTLTYKLFSGVRIANENFLDFHGHSYFMNFKELQNMSTKQLEFFCALIYQGNRDELEGIFCKGGCRFFDRKKNIKNHILRFIGSINHFENTLHSMNGSKPENLKQYWEDLMLILESASEFLDIPVDSSEFKKLKSTMDYGVAMYADVSAKDYKSLINNVVGLLKLIEWNQPFRPIDEYTNKVDSLYKVQWSYASFHDTIRNHYKEESILVYDLSRIFEYDTLYKFQSVLTKDRVSNFSKGWFGFGLPSSDSLKIIDTYIRENNPALINKLKEYYKLDKTDFEQLKPIYQRYNFIQYWAKQIVDNPETYYIPRIYRSDKKKEFYTITKSAQDSLLKAFYLFKKAISNVNPSEKQYLTIENFLILFNGLSSITKQEIFSKGDVKDLIEDFTLSIKSYTNGFMLEYVKFKEEHIEMINALAKFASFGSDMLLASNSKEISQVINRYAAPTGSYKLKRNSRWSIDLNGYVGTYIGGENTFGDGDTFEFAYGVTVPIGVTFSRGRRCRATSRKAIPSTIFASNDLNKRAKALNGAAWSVTVQLIDITAPFVFRFSSDGTNPLPDKIKWEQVFSPGAFASYHFRRTPINAFAGAAWTPNLRTIGQDPQTRNAFRLSIGLSFDLPLLNVTYKQ